MNQWKYDRNVIKEKLNTERGTKREEERQEGRKEMKGTRERREELEGRGKEKIIIM